VTESCSGKSFLSKLGQHILPLYLLAEEDDNRAMRTTFVKSLVRSQTISTALTVLVLLIAVSSSPNRLVAQLPDSETVRQHFREFYQPRISLLNKSYSNVRFRIVAVERLPGAQNDTLFTGSIRDADYVFHRHEPVRHSQGAPVGSALNSIKQSSLKIDEQGGEIGGTFFRVPGHGKDRDLNVEHNPDLRPFVFSPYIMAPICCASLHRTYQSLMDDPTIKFIDFGERRLQDGRLVMSMFFRPTERPEGQIFEADFDKSTGACVGSLEFTKTGLGDYLEYVVVVTYADDTDQSPLLPPPQWVSGTLFFGQPVIVLSYDRVGALDADEISVTRFGFKESDLLPKKSLIENVADGATNALAIVAVVLVCLLFFVGTLFLVIGLLARRHARNRQK